MEAKDCQTVSQNSPDLSVTPNSERNSFHALTGLRFFAALAVVLYHFAGPLVRNGPLVLNNILGSGFVAVSFFYVLSGFVLSYSYMRLDGSMAGTHRSFWVARFARIYPAYLLAFLLAAPYNVAWTFRVNALSAAILKLATGAFLVLTLQQAWTPWTAWYWNFPAWSVSVEAFFYLVFPFLIPLFRKFRLHSLFMLAAALWMVSLVPPSLLWLTHHAAAGNGNRLQMSLEFTPLLRLPEFIIGVLLGRCYILGYRFAPRVASILTYSSGLGVLAALCAALIIPRPLLATGLLTPLFGAMIYALAQENSMLARALSQPWLVQLGEASYAIYILQIPVAYILRMPPPYDSVKMLGLYLTVLLVASMLTWRFVELPLRCWIRQCWLFQKHPRPASFVTFTQAVDNRSNPENRAIPQTARN